LKAGYLYTAMAVGGPFEAEYLHITAAVGSPFESIARVGLHITVAVGGAFERTVLTYDLLRSISYEWILHFSPKMRKSYTRNTTTGPLKREWPRQVPRS